MARELWEIQASIVRFDVYWTHRSRMLWSRGSASLRTAMLRLFENSVMVVMVSDSYCGSDSR